MYCKFCGEKSNTLVHPECELRSTFCVYCGDKIDDHGYTYCSMDLRITFCNTNKDCANSYFRESKNINKLKFKEKYGVSDSVTDSLFDLYDSEDYDCDEIIEIIEIIKTSNNYVVILTTSDGEYSHDEVPYNKEVLDFYIKREDRKTIGMNCSQYIVCIIYKGEIVVFEEEQEQVLLYGVNDVEE
jgi:hypothetical protein